MAEERRLVTVLFADVVGSTALGESLDPEDVRALLGRLFRIARDAVEQHGGRVEKFIGDAIMAVFGLPVAHDDDPARALFAAIDLRDRVREDAMLRERIAIRIGVNTGEVIATRDADATEFLITGDPVNTAARLEQSADAWVVLVGERTHRAVGDRFRFGDRVNVEAKGKSQLVEAWPLEAFAAPDSRPPRRQHPLIGRSADLEQLELTARRAFDERRPFLVTIVAPAGVGKSRLLEEFLGRVAPGTEVAVAQCLPYGQRLTYWPMRALLLSILRLGDDATPDAILAGLEAWLREAQDQEPARTAELLAATIGASEAEAGDRLALFSAWRRFIELAAERSPLVLVIEDLHWSSDSLLDLIEAILQPRADVPLLMIALARPELLDRRATWGGGRRNALSIALEPLTESSVAALVADLLPAPSPAIVHAVVARAEGNPFYAGEIVRTLLDRLGPTASAEAIAAAVAALPDTVQATVLARLDGLEPVARRVVQLGAVLGRTFDRRALAILDPTLAADRVPGALEELVDRDLVRPSGRDQLTFRHILIREVAYGMLPRAERARLHGLAGTWLEHEAEASGREDELAELVAFHLREAATLAGLLGEEPAPDLAERTVRWLRRAGDVADAGGANVEAARHLEAAIELAPTALQADLYERLGEVWVGGEQALEAFVKAHDLGRELGLDSDQQLRTIAQAATVRLRWAGSVADRKHEAEVPAWLDEVRSRMDHATSDRARLLGHLAIAFSNSRVDLPGLELIERSKEAAIEAVTLAQALDEPNFQSSALDALATVEIVDSQVKTALEIERRRMAIADRISTGERLDAWIMQSWMDILLGDLDGAVAATGAAVQGLGVDQAPAWTAGALSWRVLALHWLGRWDEALADAARMDEAWRESQIRGPWFLVNGLVSAFTICRARGDAVSADHWRDEVLGIFRRSDENIRTQQMRAYVEDRPADLESAVVDNFLRFTGRLDYPAVSMAFLADRRHLGPTAKLDTIIEYMESRGIQALSAHGHRLRGIRRADDGDLAAALTQFEAMGARPYVARVRTELGLLTANHGLVEQGVVELEKLGDIEQGARVASERKSGAAWLGSAKARIGT